MKLAALRLYREYGYIPIALVHDELLYEEDEMKAQEAAINIKRIMENLVSLKVPLRSKVNIGKKWSNVH